MEPQPTLQPADYEQTLEAKPTINGEEPDERAWSRLAICSLAKYWDTPEEDEAWAYLQKAT